MKASKASDEIQILGGGQVGVEVRLFRNVTDSPFITLRIVVEPLAEERQRAARCLDQADHHVDGRALAGTVRTEIPENLTRADAEADLIDRQQCLVALGQVACFKHVTPTIRLAALRWD